MKKQVAFITSAAVLATMINVMVPASADTTDSEYTQFPLTIEAENMTLNGLDVWTNVYGREIPNYSGDGFIYLTGGTATMTVTVPEDGMYEISTSYAQFNDEGGRGETISVNGTKHLQMFPHSETWTDYNWGMFRLNAGENTISILTEYGYAAIDTVTVKEAEFPSLDVEPTLSDKNATSETQALMNYLTDVYGNYIISGQQEIYGGGNDGNYELEFDFIQNLTGKLPAIRGFDFMNYNPMYGWDDNTTERIIDWVNNKGGIATACWHINVPKDFASYTVGEPIGGEDAWMKCTYKPNETDFNTANAVVEGTKEYEFVDTIIEDLAEQLLRLQEAGVPIILRPFHEAEGNGGLDGSGSWFWWSSAGVDVYKQLWKRLYTTLTEDYGLHNIIWEENLYAWSDESAQWYVGDDYVDIVGLDKYNVEFNRHDGKPSNSGPNEDAESGSFYSLVNAVNGKKMVSMPENDSIPSMENMLTEKAYWLYFCPWYGDHILSDQKNNPETVKATYQSESCITLDELPENLKTYGLGESGSTTQPISTTTISETTTTLAVTETETKPPVTTTVTTEIQTKITTSETMTVTTVIETDSTTATTTSTSATSAATTTTASSTTMLPIIEPLYGDVNEDGKVSLADAVRYAKYLAGSVTLSSQALLNADCNGDGAPDEFDITPLVNYLVRTIKELPYNGLI